MSFQPRLYPLRRLFDWLFRAEDGRIVIWQFPNMPLWVAFAAYVVRRFSSAWLHTLSAGVCTVALLSWAVLELVSGVNRFRRMLGLVVLCSVLVSILQQLL